MNHLHHLPSHKLLCYKYAPAVISCENLNGQSCSKTSIKEDENNNKNNKKAISYQEAVILHSLSLKSFSPNTATLQDE